MANRVTDTALGVITEKENEKTQSPAKYFVNMASFFQRVSEDNFPDGSVFQTIWHVRLVILIVWGKNARATHK